MNVLSGLIGVLWKAVYSETGLYSLGRGQRRRAAKYLAGALLHSREGGAGDPARDEVDRQRGTDAAPTCLENQVVS